MCACREMPWLSALRRYALLMLVLVANLPWETAQLPLYTLWRTGSWPQIVYAVVHCTLGDVMIACAALVLALAVAGDPLWPGRAALRVALISVIAGLGYTIYGEWLNVEVRRSWAYSEAMPRLPWLGTGAAPFAQWIVVPAFVWWRVVRGALRSAKAPAG